MIYIKTVRGNKKLNIALISGAILTANNLALKGQIKESYDILCGVVNAMKEIINNDTAYDSPSD